MGKRFPTIRFYGDEAKAATYLKEARQELYRTKALKKRLGDPVFARTVQLDETTSVYILIEKEQEFIYITTTVPKQVVEEFKEEKVEKEKFTGIYSGFAYSHQNIGSAMHNFEPTLACRAAFPEDFGDAHYPPVTRLKVTANTQILLGGAHTRGYLDSFRYDSPGSTISQTNLLHPCQFSGPLARACSLALGLGTLNISGEERLELLGEDAHTTWKTVVSTIGFQVEYDFRRVKTHNLYRDELKRWWLILINADGVYARRLPLLKNTNVRVRHPEERKAIGEFAGIPSGEAFPATFDPETAGYLTMMDSSSATWNEFNQESFFSDSAGWVFNNDGSEGRVCTYKYDSDGWLVITYWRMTFTVQDKLGGRVTNAWATLNRIESSIAARPAVFDHSTNSVIDAMVESPWEFLPVIFYNPVTNQLAPFPITANSPGYINPVKFAKIPEQMEITCWVGWINDAWHEIKYRAPNIGHWQFSEIGMFQPEVKLDPVADWTFQGHIPWVLGNGVTVNREGPETKAQFPSCPAYEVADYEEKIKHWYRDEVVTNQRIAGPAVVRITGGHDARYQRMDEARQVHWERVSRYQSEKWRLLRFIIPPYNRNAYFIYDYDWAGGIMEAWSSFFRVHSGYEQITGYAYGALADAFTADCDVPDPYPHPFLTGYLGRAATQNIPAPPDPEPDPQYWYETMGDYAWGVSAGDPEAIHHVFTSIGIKQDGAFEGETDIFWGSRTEDETACSGNFECYCVIEAWNQWHSTYHVRRDWLLLSAPDDPAFNYVDWGWVWMMPEKQFGGGGMFVDPVDETFPADYGDRVFSYPAQYPKHHSRVRHWFPPTHWGHLQMGLVANGFEYKDFGLLELYSDDEDFVYGMFRLIHYGEDDYPEQGRAFWCQMSVSGDPAMIYTDPMKGLLTPAPTEWTDITFPLEAEGVHPMLPEAIPTGNLQYATLDYKDVYRYLTFVGVNGP